MKPLLRLHFLLLWTLIVLSGSAWPQDAGYFRGPYLAQSTPHSMTIVWRTAGAITPVVRYGATPQSLGHSVDRSSIKIRVAGAGQEPLSSAPAGAHQYEATLTGLAPRTKYYYAVYDGDKRLAGGDDTFYFVTHPPVGTKAPFRFWVVGDSGTGGRDQARVHDAMRAFIAKQQRPLDFYLHVGDMAYSNGKDDEFQRKFFEPYKETLRNVVCWPSMGNHEGHTSNGKTGVGPYYDAYVTPTRGEAGGLASGTEAYYSFDYANVHFVCLNSHDLDRSPAAAMARWLKADLEATNADWIVAYWHHPPYTKGSHDSDKERQLIEMRQHIMPILEAAGVDLVLTGHSHIYERSMLIDGAYDTPTVAENFVLDDGDGDPDGDGAYRKSEGLRPHEGAVQVVAGHGGTGLRRVGTMPVMKRVFVEHGSVIVDVEDDTLTAIMLNADGVQRDLFSIIKRGHVALKRIAKPKQLPPYVRLDQLASLTVHPLAAGITARAAIEFQQIPDNVLGANATARIEWNTAGTSWQIEPKEAVVPLQTGRNARQEFALAYRDKLFPLPTARITYDAGKGQGDPQSGDFGGTVNVSPTLAPHQQAPLPEITTAPAIDGVLSPQELDGLLRQSDFVVHRGTGPAQFPTEFYAGLHGNSLYLAVVNHEPDAAKIKLENREFDGPLWSDDSNEIFIQREGDPKYYQFIVNAEGQRYDSIGTNAKWNGDWITKTRRGNDRWISESLISLDMLGAPFKAGDKIRFNLVRNNNVQGESSQWSFTNRAGNHSPQYFGTLAVEGK